MTAEVLPWRYPPVPDVLDSEWLRSAYEAGTIPAREAAPDLAIVLAQAHAADHAGRGPSARGEISAKDASGPVPCTWARRRTPGTALRRTFGHTPATSIAEIRRAEGGAG